MRRSGFFPLSEVLALSLRAYFGGPLEDLRGGRRCAVALLNVHKLPDICCDLTFAVVPSLISS